MRQTSLWNRGGNKVWSSASLWFTRIRTVIDMCEKKAEKFPCILFLSLPFSSQDTDWWLIFLLTDLPCVLHQHFLLRSQWCNFVMWRSVSYFWLFSFILALLTENSSVVCKTTRWRRTVRISVKTVELYEGLHQRC